MSLLFDPVPTILQFDDQCVLVKLFVEARPQRVQHFHRRTDDRLAEFVMNQFGHDEQFMFLLCVWRNLWLIDLTTDFADGTDDLRRCGLELASPHQQYESRANFAQVVKATPETGISGVGECDFDLNSDADGSVVVPLGFQHSSSVPSEKSVVKFSSESVPT